MRRYFISGGHIFDVEMLGGLSDEEAVAKAKLLFSEHEGPYSGVRGVGQSSRCIPASS